MRVFVSCSCTMLLFIPFGLTPGSDIYILLTLLNVLLSQFFVSDVVGVDIIRCIW